MNRVGYCVKQIITDPNAFLHKNPVTVTYCYYTRYELGVDSAAETLPEPE